LNRFTVLLLFFILISSPVVATSSFAESLITDDPKSQNLLNNNFEKSKTEQYYNINISVADGIYTNGLSDLNEKLNQQKSTVTKSKIINIHIQDSISTKDLRENLDDVKQNSDGKASMERIWNNDKLRFNGKGFVVTNLFDNYQTTIFDERLNIDLEQEKNNLINTIERDNFIFATPYKNQPLDVVLVQTQNGFDSTVVETLPITEIEISNLNSNNQNEFLIVFLSVPLVGLLFVNSPQRKFESSSFRKISCLSLSIILLSSAVSFPVSISTIYWGEAFAETSEDIAPLQDVTYTVPPSSESIHFDNISKEVLVNNGVDFFIDNENPAALFDGNDDYLKISSPEIFKEDTGFTISSWVKPNYDSGSAKFSVISMTNAFELSINNKWEPEKIATFSIFDGIKWHTIQSKSLVNEEWTHIVATFSDSSITLYINGEKESTLENITTISIEKGKIIPIPLQTLSPESDMFVGALQNSGDDLPSNYYSGLIDSIEIFDSALGLEQINALNEKNRESNYQATSSEIHSEQVIETFVGVPNKFGFVADEEQDNSQEIEEAASNGFKVAKKESKKKPLAFPGGATVTTSSDTSTKVQPFDDETTVTTSSDTSTEFDDGTTVTTSSDTSTEFSDGTTVTTSSDTSTEFSDGTTVTTSSDTSTEFDDGTTVTTSSDTSTEFGDETTVTTSSDTSTEFGDETTVTTSSDTSTNSGKKSGPTITTNKNKYVVGETVLISGSDFLSDHTIYLNVTRDDVLAAEWEVLSNQVGIFDTFYVIDISGKHFEITATDGTNTASTTFVDPGPVVVDYRQCSNDTGICIWINGILQQNNSIYFEGDFVPQRTIFTGIHTTTGDLHSLDFSSEFTKGGVHAFDFLVGYDQGPNNAAGSLTECGVNIGPPATLGATCSTIRGGANSFTFNIPVDTFISKDGLISTRIAEFVTVHQQPTMTLFGNSPISTASLAITHTVVNGADTGDSDTLYTLSWQSASTEILIELAGHLAMSGDPTSNPLTWGSALGAGSISGGPYHFKLMTLDGASLGNQDNQIKGADLLGGPVLITVSGTDNLTTTDGSTVTVTSITTGVMTAQDVLVTSDVSTAQATTTAAQAADATDSLNTSDTATAQSTSTTAQADATDSLNTSDTATATITSTTSQADATDSLNTSDTATAQSTSTTSQADATDSLNTSDTATAQSTSTTAQADATDSLNTSDTAASVAVDVAVAVARSDVLRESVASAACGAVVVACAVDISEITIKS